MSQQISGGEAFTSISPAEFFYRNRQMAGFGNPTLAVYSTVRELVENSLDACDDSGRLPVVTVDITTKDSDAVSVTVSDNGTGVPYEHVAEAFGRVLFGNKYSARQRRGTFGLGATMAALYGQVTTDCPLEVHTQTEESTGKAYRLFIDIEHNVPVVETVADLGREGPGTSVTVHLKGDFKRAQDRVLEYLRMTSVASPHARLLLRVNAVPQAEFGPWTDTPPRPTTASKPHPRGADVELLKRMISGNSEKRLKDFLTGSFQQIGDRTASRLLRYMCLDPRKSVGSFTREEVSLLSAALRSFDGFNRPEADCLSPLGKEVFLTSVGATFEVSFSTYSRRGPSDWDGNPFIIEGVLAIGTGLPPSEVPTLYRFANRVPLLYDSSEDVFMKSLKKIDWTRYGLTASQPVSVFIHLCSTRVPYRAAGKQSIAPIPEIEAEALPLFREMGRAFSKSAEKIARSAHDIKKLREFAKSFRMVAGFGAALAESEPPSTDHLVASLFEVNDNV